MLECIDGVDEVSDAVERGALAAPALRPVGLQLGGLVGVLEGLVEVFERGVGA